jgi:hypothetical protein
MATDIAKKWNNQWWTEVVKKKKASLPTIHNVRAKKAKRVKKMKSLD